MILYNSNKEKEITLKRKAYIITTQNLEEYGENYHKFKGGSTYVVYFDVDLNVYEQDAYGPGEHSYYECPSVTEASVAAEVMKHVNMHNGLRGSFDYITNIETVDAIDCIGQYDDAYFKGDFDELIFSIKEYEVLNIEVA